MTDITFRSDFSVELIRSSGGDESVLEAMLVSTLKDQGSHDPTNEQNRGRINFLMKGRHGTPFEHNQMVFRVEAPIFVYREWHRHRIGISINEQSGRYTEFEPVFYIPPPHRDICQTGKPGAYIYTPGTEEQINFLKGDMMHQAYRQWESYQERLDKGIALEVARMSMGVNIYSTMYWTANARSIMSFLSLRTRETEETAMFPSKPMWEIDQCARALEVLFADSFPVTHESFVKNKRVSP